VLGGPAVKEKRPPARGERRRPLERKELREVNAVYGELPQRRRKEKEALGKSAHRRIRIFHFIYIYAADRGLVAGRLGKKGEADRLQNFF
jgi:hypothetical protein